MVNMNNKLASFLYHLDKRKLFIVINSCLHTITKTAINIDHNIKSTLYQTLEGGFTEDGEGARWFESRFPY